MINIIEIQYLSSAIGKVKNWMTGERKIKANQNS